MKNEHQSVPETTDTKEFVIPVIEEEVVAGTQAVPTGGVRVDKHVEKRIRKIEMPLLHEEVEVQRVPVQRVVTEAPPIRKEGDVTIIPVMEEEVVVTKRLLLKEEIHIIRRSTQDRFVKEVELERERAEVHRLDAQGRVLDTPEPRAVQPAPVQQSSVPRRASATPPRRRSILGGPPTERIIKPRD